MHAAIDLSRATKLKTVLFRCQSPYSGWITRTLKTITSNHRDLKRITVRLPSTSELGAAGQVSAIGEGDPGTRWSDLDQLLDEVCESLSIRAEVVYPLNQKKGGEDWVTHFLPELKKRETTYLIESDV
jgi:hypothetical protein